MTPEEPAGAEQTLLAHLLELRSRLLKCVVGMLLVFLPLAFYSKQIYSWLAAPLLHLLPSETGMIATEVASPFFTPIKLSAIVSLVLAMPWVLYQTWAFIAPGLYRHERRLVVPLLVSSTALFYLGIAFAYFAVLPAVFHFIVGAAPEGVTVMTDIAKYLDFVLTLFIVFGLAFEMPVAIVLIVWMGFVTPAGLAKRRDYVLVGCFVAGAVLTPPDVLSQVLLALCLYLLYELGILAARLFVSTARSAPSAPDSSPPL